MKILAAEDNPVFQYMLRSMLAKWGYDVVVAGNGTEALQVLQSGDPPRLAILDWMMPGMDGLEVCRQVRAASAELYIYILLLTARAESGDLVQGMEAGADDYLTKPFNAHELRVRLRAGSRILDLQTQLLRAREALRQQATHDSLTGLLNRASILELLQTELQRGGRERSPLAVLMADLDRFKQINDTYGHLVGDATLRVATQRMKACLRRYDMIGRYGGEEFLIVLPGCDFVSGLQEAERLQRAIAAEPIRVGGLSLPVTCSLGVSWRACTEAVDTDTLVREADLALYSAKSRGRNRAELCPESAADLVPAQSASDDDPPLPALPDAPVVTIP
jgi:two-component system, cell cycle response regulator